MFRVFFDMDGTLAEWKAAKEPEDLYEKDYFLSLKPYQSVVEAAWKLYESGEAEVFILSAVLADSRYAIPEKNAWLGEYLPWVDIDHRLYVEGSVPKRLRVPGGVRMTDVLVGNVDRHFCFALLHAQIYCRCDSESRAAESYLTSWRRRGIFYLKRFLCLV